MSESNLWASFFPSTKEISAYPKVTVVIPVREEASDLAITLQSVTAQAYPNIEILIIDGSHTESVLEINRRYGNSTVKVYPVTGFSLYEMLNKGVSLATGDYVNFLYPGDSYLGVEVLHTISCLAEKNGHPSVVFGGAIIRETGQLAKLVYRPFSAETLYGGHLPTALQSIWWRRSLFEKIGYFSPRYRLRGSFEVLCRMLFHPELTIVSTSRVVTDSHQQRITRGQILNHFYETVTVLKRHFGMKKAIRWIFCQRDVIRWSHTVWRDLRVAFLGPKST